MIMGIALLGGLLVQPAFGDARDVRQPPRADLLAVEQPGPPQPRLTQQEAAARAQRQFGGRVLALRPHGAGYNVKILKDGEVRTVFISP